MAEKLSDQQLLIELEPTAEKLFSRHLENTKTWYPEELIPYSSAVDIDEQTESIESELPPGVASALYVNLLTEDNLPYYTSTILDVLGEDTALGSWTKRWTAEEGRHSIAIRGIITAKRLLNHRALEDGRMEQMSGGKVPKPESVVDAFIYTSLQELATNISHRNTGRKSGDKDVMAVMARVAGDEKLHTVFYSDMAEACLEIDPSQFILSCYKIVRHFNMPGTGIPNFETHSAQIAAAGIYSIESFRDDVLASTLDKWNIQNISGLTDEAKEKQEKLLKHHLVLTRAAKKINSQLSSQTDV